jgi:membrane protein
MTSDELDSPTDLPSSSRRAVLRRARAEFRRDHLTDLAAGLTYYATLSAVPALIVLVAVLGLLGPDTTRQVTEQIQAIAPGSSAQFVSNLIEQAQSNRTGAGIGAIVGIVVALWSASGYVAAFGRAMNRIYEIREGRPFWKLRPLFLLLTLIAVVLTAVVLLMLIVSGPVAQAIGDVIGLGDTAVTVWQYAKWPVLLIVVVLIVALLYYATPNVKQPKFRWISVGALVAIIIWILASVGFAFYVANFSSYNKTYGSLAGVIVALLFLWITNLALLFGAELDSELERGRQLEAGLPAEEDLQLPARDTRNIKKQQKKEDKDIALGRKIRNQAQRNGTTNKEHSSEKEER